jgi:acyl carrier protein
MLDEAHAFSHQPKSAPALEPARAVGDGSLIPHRPTTKRADIDDALRRVFYQTASQAVDESMPVLQQGLDSISSVEFTQSLEKAVGVRLPLTFVYDYPLPEDMIAFIEAEIGGDDSDGGGGPACSAAARSSPSTLSPRRSKVVNFTRLMQASFVLDAEWLSHLTQTSAGSWRYKSSF